MCTCMSMSSQPQRREVDLLKAVAVARARPPPACCFLLVVVVVAAAAAARDAGAGAGVVHKRPRKGRVVVACHCLDGINSTRMLDADTGTDTDTPLWPPSCPRSPMYMYLYTTLLLTAHPYLWSSSLHLPSPPVPPLARRHIPISLAFHLFSPDFMHSMHLHSISPAPTALLSVFY